MPDRPSHAILYDAGCGFCRWSLGWVLRWDRGRVLRPVALQSAEAPALLPGLDEARRLASWHLVDPEGRVRSAGTAVPGLLRLLPGGSPLGALCERFPGAVDRAYAWVACNRGSLGRLVSGGARKRADRVIAERGIDRATGAPHARLTYPG